MYDAVLFTENTNEIQISIPLGAFKVASVLRKHGYPTLVVNHMSAFSLEEFKKIIDIAVSDQTKIVGFSTTFLQKKEIRNGEEVFVPVEFDTLFPQGKEFEIECISYIKSKNPNVKILSGGGKTIPECSNINVDYAFIGYSETSIVNLMDHIVSDSPLNKSFVNQSGITIVDDRTAPNYRFVDDSMVWQDTDIVNHKVLPIEIGRGCIFKCKFCSFPLNGKKNLDYMKDPNLIYEELLDNYNRFGIYHYLIVDDTFNDHVGKLQSLEEVIKKLPFQPLFWCYTRLDLLCTRPETLPMLYNIGVRAMYFGIETLDLTAGRIIGKGYDRTKQIAMISHIRETYPDVSMHGGFIAGLPKEPLDSIKLTCSQLANGEIPLHSWMIRPLFINENTTALNFNSDINVNYKSYGYESTGTHSGYILWKNEHTDIFEAGAVSRQCMSDSRQKDYFKIPGHDSFEMVNFGYDFHDIHLTPFVDFRWDIVKTELFPKFITDYKSQLFNMLEQRPGGGMVDTQR